MFFIGIDVHKKQSQICVLDVTGELVSELRVPTSRPDLADVLRIYRGARVLIESCTPSEWVACHLESLGLEVIVADPGFAPMYATRSKKVKTDKRDARCLAQACRLGAYKPAHRLSPEQRQVRAQMDVRTTLVQMRTQIINQIGALLLGQGYRVGSGAAEQFQKRLEKLDLPAPVLATLEPLLALLGPINEQIGRLEEQLTQRAQQDPQARRLQGIPGVGPLTALMFLATLDGAHRFDNAHQVMSYLGLVPREYSSGEKQLRGHITKAGSSRMRVLLVQASLTMMRLDKPQTQKLCAWAQRIVQRRGKRIAVVALSRRLSGIMWAMLRDGAEYQANSPSRRPGADAAVSPGAAAQAA
jgi:transposase